MAEEKSVFFKRLVNGFAEYGLDYYEVMKSWFYCGDSSNNQDRFFAHYPDCEIPKREERCVCGQTINVNHYITDGSGSIVVMGSCCIRNYTNIKMTKVCINCHANHKNRTTDFCNICRKLQFCVQCKRVVNKWEIRCQGCILSSTKCKCGKSKKAGYKRCYHCTQNMKEVYKEWTSR